MAEIQNTNSVSVHIRGGDYLNNEEIRKFHGFPGLPYLEQCVEYIAARVEKPHFYIFSNDFEWVEKNFWPLIDTQKFPVNSVLRTIYEHISNQITKVIQSNSSEKILITGGGAYNSFLISILQEKTEIQIIIPEKQIVEFKEALIFAFLGVLRWESENNCLATVTGAIKDCCGGAIYYHRK